MKRFFNVLRNTATALSLLLCLGTLALLARSYRIADYEKWTDQRRIITLGSCRGELHYFDRIERDERYGYDQSAKWTYSFFDQSEIGDSVEMLRHPGWWNRAGFVFELDSKGSELVGRLGAAKFIVLPHWIVAAALSIAPLLFLKRLHRTRREQRRMRRGLCRACGYDLRATPQRCPECGTESGEKKKDTGAGDAPVSKDFT